MTKNSEKRTSQRVPDNTPILFTVNHPENSGELTETSQQGTIMDISATGMGIYTTTHITTGQYVNFVKNQPNWELPGKGLVVWSLKHGNGFRVGLEFIM